MNGERPRPRRSADAASRRQTAARQRAAARRRNQILIVAAAVMLLAAGVIVVSALTRGSSSPAVAAAGDPVDGTKCEPMEKFLQHIHQHLEVVVDGKVSTAPAGVGIIPNKQCYYWLHSHEADGIIHVESPNKNVYRLGNFLDIWAISPVDPSLYSSIVGRKPDLIWLNGKKYTGDVRAIPLTAHAQITLEYGTPTVPQKPFNFGQL